MKVPQIVIDTNILISARRSKRGASNKEYLEERAKRGSRETLLAILAEAPDVEPEEYDRL